MILRIVKIVWFWRVNETSYLNGCTITFLMLDRLAELREANCVFYALLERFEDFSVMISFHLSPFPLINPLKTP